MNDLYLDSDGTLGISADVDISKVKRILLTQEGTHYGSMYYLDDSDHSADVSKMVNGDAVSRQAAIEALYKKAFRLTVAEEYCYEGHVAWSANVVYRDVMEGALLELPSAQLEPHWIPCSERLPKKHGESYLVTISDGAVYTTTLQWDANGKRWYLSFFNDGNILVDFIDDVIAWLPLPEPYQTERWE